MKSLYAPFILLFVFSAFIAVEGGFALNPDFYRQKKIKKELKRQRERGASSLAGIRKSENLKKKKAAREFKKVRSKMKLAKKKREAFLEQDAKDKEKFKSRKINQALRSAKKRRKKPEIGWREESLEYDIPIPLKKKNKK